jgi:anti-sigma factor RsiW
MPCKKIILELSNYLDNEMDSALRLEFEEHMGHCPDCRVVIDTTRQTIEIYRGCEPVPLPHGLHDRLQQAIRRHREKPSSEDS